MLVRVHELHVTVETDDFLIHVVNGDTNLHHTKCKTDFEEQCDVLTITNYIEHAALHLMHCKV